MSLASGKSPLCNVCKPFSGLTMILSRWLRLGGRALHHDESKILLTRITLYRLMWHFLFVTEGVNGEPGDDWCTLAGGCVNGGTCYNQCDTFWCDCGAVNALSADHIGKRCETATANGNGGYY